MRRRWLLVGLGLALVGLAAWVGASLLVDRAPFRFLEGQEPIRRTRINEFRVSDLYSFRGDATAIRRRMEAELFSRGFVKVGGIYQTEGSPPELVVLNAMKTELDHSRPGRLLRYRLLPGWVSVTHQYSSQTLWSRMKRLVGL